MPVSAIFNAFTAIIITRTVFESILEAHSFSKAADLYKMLVGYAHSYISWLCLFVAVALLVAWFLKARFIDALTLVLYGSPLIIVVPFIDYFVAGGGSIFYGETFSDFIYNYLNLFNPFDTVQMVSLGVRVEVFIAVVGSYFIARRYFKAGSTRSLCFSTGLYSLIFGFGYLPALMPNLARQSNLGYFPLYLPIFCGLVALVLMKVWRENRKLGSVIFHLLFPSRLAFYLLLAGFGAIFAARTDGFSQGRWPAEWVLRYLLASVSITLLFVNAKIQNDFYDRKIDCVSDPDRPVIYKVTRLGNARNIGLAVLVPSFAFAVAAERYFFMLWLLIYALSYLYSEPPMRLRSIYPIGHYVLSLVGVAAFLAGGLLIRSQSFFTLHGVSDLAGCIFISFFCLSHIKDLKDIEGDRRGNVMNVYNLTNYPRWIGMGAVVGFSVTLYFILQILAVYNSVVLMAIAGYLFVALLAILTAPDLRRLDWIIPFSMVLVVFISLVWLFGEWP